MKVYSCPDAVPAPAVDYRNFDYKKVLKQQEAHRKALADHYRSNGYTGTNTGKTLSFPVADGAAEYMLIEGKRSFLLHLPYGDGYQYRDVSFLPKAEIIRRIKQESKLESIFGKRA